MIQSSIRRLIHAAFATDQPAIDAICSIYYMDIKIRKAFLTLCQSQSMPDPETTVALRLAEELQTKFEVVDAATSFRRIASLQEIVQPLRTYIQSPFLAGLINMLIKNIPFHDITSARKTFESGLEKEIGAAMEEYHPCRLNWTSILSHDHQERRRQKFHSEYGHRADVRHFVYKSIKSAGSRITRRPIYPTIGSKTIGYFAFEDMKQAFVGWRYDGEEITASLADVERLYSQTGVVCHGITELRWSWKYSQLKPRIYYARGPTDYHASKYIQPIFNLLVDALPTVHRRERFDARSIQLYDETTLFIYDYTSFTSLFEEIKNFNLALATFFTGTLVDIVDTHLGVISVDLGELLMFYHETCSLYPNFDISSCNWDRIRSEEPISLVHTCGMLGVPGNISSCTLAHGIHLIMVLEDLGCKVVGDDAIGATLEGPDEVLQKLRNIGRIEESKVERWQGETNEPDQGLGLHAWNYVKRPITRIANHVIQGFQLSYPPICDFLNTGDEFHTLPDQSDSIGLLIRRCNTLLSFIVQIQFISQTPSEIDLETMNGFYHHLRHIVFDHYHRLGRPSVNVFLLPSELRISFDFDAWFGEFMTVSMRVPCEEPEEVMEFSRYGQNVGLMTSPLSLAVKLKYGEAKILVKTVFPKDCRELFHRLLLKSGPIKALYTFTLFVDCPGWLVDLIVQDHLDQDNGYTLEEANVELYEWDSE